MITARPLAFTPALVLIGVALAGCVAASSPAMVDEPVQAVVTPTPITNQTSTATPSPEPEDAWEALAGVCAPMRVVDADAVLGAWTNPVEMEGVWAEGLPPIADGDAVCASAPDGDTVVLAFVDETTHDLAEPFTEWATSTGQSYDWEGWGGLTSLSRSGSSIDP